MSQKLIYVFLQNLQQTLLTYYPGNDKVLVQITFKMADTLGHFSFNHILNLG